MKTVVTVHIPDSREAGDFVNNGAMTLLSLINHRIYSLMGKEKIIGGFSKVLKYGTFHYILEINTGYGATDIQRELNELVSRIPGTSIQ